MQRALRKLRGRKVINSANRHLSSGILNKVNVNLIESMPFISPGKRRESTTRTAEQYKYVIRKYYEARGYAETRNSFVDGTLADMIFVPTNYAVTKSNVWVEAKYENLGISDGELRKEILKYLTEWLRLPKSDRFEFHLFVKAAKASTKWETLFNVIDTDTLMDWLSGSIQLSGNILLKEFMSNNSNEVKEFFVKSWVYNWDIPDIENALEEITMESRLSISNMAQRELESMNNHLAVGQKRDVITANMYKITVPNVLAKLRAKKQETERLEYYRDFLPPFANLSPEYLITYNEQDTIKQFSEYTLTNETVPLSALERDYQRPLVHLFNQSIGKLFLKTGANYLREDDLYYFTVDYIHPVKSIQGISQRQVQVAKILFKEEMEDDGKSEPSIDYGNFSNSAKTLNFGFHKAFRVGVKRIWDSYYVSISIKKLYTSDGKTPVSGESRKRIDRYFRNSIFNQSDSYKTVVFALLHQLELIQSKLKEDENYLKNLAIGGPLEERTVTSPVTLELNQSVLELEFEEDMEDHHED